MAMLNNQRVPVVISIKYVLRRCPLQIMWPFFAAIPEEVVALHPEETSAGSKIRVHLRASQPLSDRSIKWFPHLWLLSTRNLKLHMWKWRIVVPLTHTQDQWITDSQGLSHLWVSQYGPQIHCVLFLIHFGFPLVLLAHHYRGPLGGKVLGGKHITTGPPWWKGLIWSSELTHRVRCTFAPLANPPPRRLGVEVVYLPNTNLKAAEQLLQRGAEAGYTHNRYNPICFFDVWEVV